MNYTMLNNFLLVETPEDTKTLGNGLALKETRGKRDIVCARTVSASKDVTEKTGLKVGTLIWFPLYAASSIDLNGKQYLVVDFSDVIMYTEEEGN